MEPTGRMLRFIQQAVLILLIGIFAQTASAQIEGVRVVGDGETTRITIWSSAPVDVRSFASETGSAQQVRVDFDLSVNASGPSQEVPAATGVSGYRWQDGFLAFELLFSRRPPSIQARMRSASFLAILSPLGGMNGSAVWVTRA